MEAAELSLHGMGAVDAPLTADTRTRDALLSNAHPEQEGNGCPTGRRRAQSVASVSTVETVIVKAKRAASSLWMLLHSQVRSMSSNIEVPQLKPTYNSLAITFSRTELCHGDMFPWWLSGSQASTSAHQDLRRGNRV